MSGDFPNIIEVPGLAAARLQRVLDSITDGLAILDANWRYTYVNEQGARMLGLRAGDLIGGSLWQLFPHAEGSKFFDGYHEAVKTGQPVHFEGYCPAPLDKWMECHCYPSEEGLSVYFRDITDRKRAEKELSDSAARLQHHFRIFDNTLSAIADFVYVLNREGRFLYVNQPLLDLWGLTLDQALGKNFHDLRYPEELADKLHAQVEQVYATGRVVSDETPYQSPTGQGGYYEYIFSPVLAADGSVEVVAGSTRDITDRKMTEEQLRTSESRLRLAADAAGMGIWVWDVQQDHVSWENDRPYEIFGMTKEDGPLKSERFRAEFLHEEDADIFESSIQEALSSGNRFHFLGRIRKSGGDVRWIEFTGQPVPSAGGTHLRMHGTAADVTERQEAEEYARRGAEVNAKIRTIFDQSNQYSGLLALDGTLMEVNRLALEASGFTREEVVGKAFWDCGWWSRSAEIRQSIKDICIKAADGELFQGETASFFADGRLRFVDLTVAPVKDDNGTVLFISTTGVDITERKRLEEQIRAQTEELAEQARRKDEFLAMLSHELRNPLAPIQSAIQLLQLKDDPSPELKKRALDILERQVGNLTKLVSDLLEVSRVVSGRIHLDLHPVELNEILRHAAQATASLMEKKGHIVTFNFCDDSVWVLADQTRIEEVFTNLLNNAAKYTPDGGRIELHCDSHEGFARVRVIDNGMGISEDLLPRIFELFSQADHSLDRAEGGLGIGLSLAKKLVEMHMGTIVAMSPSEGRAKGSEFMVRLPACDPPSAGPEQLHIAPIVALVKKILVVEDNADLRTLVTSVLAARGYEVRQASTGPEGLLLAHEWMPEVVLLDIGLPGMDGFAVARALRSQISQPMRLIALTGYGRDTDIQLAEEAGFDGHLTKPFSFEALERLMSPEAFR